MRSNFSIKPRGYHNSTYICVTIHTSCRASSVYVCMYLCIHVNVCMYVYMYVCMYGHTYSKKDQPGKVANPARGQLNRENEYFHVRVRA